MMNVKMATLPNPKSSLGHAALFAFVLGICLACLAVWQTPAATKVKLHGFLTGRADANTLLILDDRIELTSASRVLRKDPTGESALRPEELEAGMLVEAEGQWLDKHKFFAEKITVDAVEDAKKIHGSAYLQEEPTDAPKIAGGEASELKADGYWLLLGGNTKREWNPAKAREGLTGGPAAGNAGLAGDQLRYSGTLRKDGKVEAETVELGPPAQPDDYKMPHSLEVVAAKDSLTGIGVLEFRQGKSVKGRMKLLAEPSVQEYVSHLGDSLIPEGAKGTSRPVEFRFFVVEDPSINAFSLPDGTVLINTGLLGAIQNEAQLAFVLSHEMAHVLQVHSHREAEETRGARVGLLIAGIAAGVFIGNEGLFFAEIGIASVVNGHQRELENQADRLGLQNVIEHGYDPREAPNFSRIVISRYGDRTTSAIWSNHDSSLMRGSFLTVQLTREYPEGQWDGAKKNTATFQTMKEDLGPVKIM